MTRRARSGVTGGSSLLLVWSFFALALLLSGCAPVERQQARAREWWAQLTGTASGAIAVTRATVEGTVETGKQAAEDAQEMLQDLQDRTAKMQEGIEKIQEGKKLIEEGIGK